MPLASLILFAFAHPAPPDAASPIPIALGEPLSCDWSACRQTMQFSRDGQYESRPYGSGPYTIQANDDGTATIEFREGPTWYVMRIDRNGVGSGARLDWDDDGRATYSGPVDVKIFRRAPMPKGPQP